MFDRHSDAAFSLAYRMCGRRSMAEDVVQEAFVSLWRSGARYDATRGSVRSWVLSVVHNRAIDVFRRETRTDEPRRRRRGRRRAGRRARADRGRGRAPRRGPQVRTALGELPADQRQVIELAYFGGFTHSSDRGDAELPGGTVKGRMRLGLTKMRVALGGDTARSCYDRARR